MTDENKAKLETLMTKLMTIIEDECANEETRAKAIKDLQILSQIQLQETKADNDYDIESNKIQVELKKLDKMEDKNIDFEQRRKENNRQFWLNLGNIFVSMAGVGLPILAYNMNLKRIVNYETNNVWTTHAARNHAQHIPDRKPGVRV